MARACRGRLLPAAALLGMAATAACPASALADPSIPGWRNFTEAGKIVAGPGGGADPPVQLVSRRGGRAGIDRLLENPTPNFGIRVRGRVLSGQGKLNLEWIDGEERVVRTAERVLNLRRGVTEHRFASPAGADRLRIAVLQEDGDSVLELDSVELRGAGGRMLVNEDLALAGCPDDNVRRTPPFGTQTVPRWRREGPESFFQLVRRGQRSPPLRVVPLEGPGGLSQSVRASSLPLTVGLRGEGRSPGTALAVEWTDIARQTTVQDTAYPVRLNGGAQVIQVPPPAAPGPLAVTVAVTVPRAGSLALDSITARSANRQLLANPRLRVRACPPAPVEPEPAETLPRSLRWLVTAALLALAALFLALIARRRPGQDGRDWRDLPPTPGKWTRVALLTAVALVPFVSVGTVKVGVRIIPADWIFLGLAIVLLGTGALRRAAVSDRTRIVALSSAIALAIVTGISLILALRFWTDPNLAGLRVGDRLVSDLGRPAPRGAVEELRLIQGVACLFVILALVHTPRMWISVARVVAVAGAVAATYGIYQVGVQAAFGDVPQLPFAYQARGLKAGGTFPEPTAFAGFLVFAAACAAAVLELRRSRWMAVTLLVIIGGVVASRSTVGLVGLGILLLALAGLGRLRTTAVLGVLAVVAVAAAVALGGSTYLRETYEKPFGVSSSLLDREAVWGAAARMGATYAPAGAGRGQFAYNQAPFVDPADANRGGRANSAILEYWAEAGPLGTFFWAAAVLVGPLTLLRRRRARDGPPGSARMVVWALLLSFIAVMALYYTTSFVWSWLAVGLLAAAPRALSPRAPVEPPPVAAPAPDAPVAIPDEPRRVLHVMRMTGVSGAERHLYELTAALRGQGWRSDVLILSPHPAALRDFADELAGVCDRVAVLPMKRGFSPALVWRLTRLFRSRYYAVAHTHLVHADWHGGLASLLTRRTPLVSSKHNHDPFRKRFGVRHIERATARRYDEVISISESLSQFTREWSGTRSTTVLYGLSAPDGDSAPSREPDPGSLLAVGRLEPQKGFDVLLRAMPTVLAAAPAASLAIAGEGSERERLERLIDELDLGDSVELLGLRDDVPTLMRGAAMLVHPARWEGFGLVLLEAMREGLPITATAVGAVPEVTEDGVTAILVPPEDPRLLAIAIVRMLAEPRFAATAGLAGFRRLERQFAPKRMAREVAEIYERALTQRRAGRRRRSPAR